MEIKTVRVENKVFLAKKCYGFEYEDPNVFDSVKGFPFEPFRYQRVLDGEHAYIVDAKGIVWVLEDGNLSRPCLYFCLHYILYFDQDMKGRKASEIFEIIGVNDPRTSAYDDELKQIEEMKNNGEMDC